MPSFPAAVDPRTGLSDQVGEATARLEQPGFQDIDGPPQWLEASLVEVPEPLESVHEAGAPVAAAPVAYPAVVAQTASDDWFEKIHALPRRIDLGTILGTVIQTIDLFNAYRKQAHSLDSFDNNAGAGVTITDLPSLPADMANLDSLSLTLQVTTEGPALIDGTLDYTFDVSEASQPITGTRTIFFGFRPEAPMRELLEFLTEVLLHLDGTEQRISLRKNPRQSFELDLLLEDGPERQRLEYMLFDWQANTFAVPVWFEAAVSRAAVSPGQTVVQVDSTDYADFRVGGSAVLFQDLTSYEILQIQSIASDSLTFSSPTTLSFPAGIEVMPVRSAVTDAILSGSRFPVNAAKFRVRFRVLDNDSDLADVSDFSEFNSKVLLDDLNAILGGSELPEQLHRRLIQFDSRTGKFSQATPQNRSRRVSAKGFVATSRAQLWSIRKLLHALRGRQVSFYLPTYFKDLEVADTINSGTTNLVVTNVGYAQFAQHRQPKNVIRLLLSNGTVLTRTVVDSVNVDADTDQLTVDSSWPSTVDPADVVRVDLFEEVRLDSDTVEITHLATPGHATTGFPVRTVLE